MHLRSWHLWCLLLSLRVCQPGWNVVRWLKFNFMNFITFLAGSWLPNPSSGLGHLSVHDVLRNLCQQVLDFSVSCFLFYNFWFLLLSGTCASGFGVCCTFQVNSFVDKRQKCEQKRTNSVSFQSQSFSGFLWWIDLGKQHLLCKVWTVNLIWCCLKSHLNSIIWQCKNFTKWWCSPTATMKTLHLARFPSARPTMTSVWWETLCFSFLFGKLNIAEW